MLTPPSKCVGCGVRRSPCHDMCLIEMFCVYIHPLQSFPRLIADFSRNRDPHFILRFDVLCNASRTCISIWFVAYLI